MPIVSDAVVRVHGSAIQQPNDRKDLRKQNSRLPVQALSGTPEQRLAATAVERAGDEQQRAHGTEHESRRATQAAIAASVETPGLMKISAGNYGGKLGKSFVYLHPEKQPS